MKKLIALIVTLGLITTMSLTSFAAVTVTKGADDAITINATATDEEGVYTFDEATTTFETTTSATDANGQTTILAVSGYNGTAASITTNSIQYINQGTEMNFTFALKEGLITEENPNAVVTILMGGDNMPEDKPVTVATLTIATVDDEGGEEPDVPGDTETITISGTVSGYSGTTLPTVIVTDGTTDYPATVAVDGTFSVDVPKLDDGSYTLTATKVGHTKYVKANIGEEITTLNPVIKAGNTNGDTIINLDDIVKVIGCYEIQVGADGYDAACNLNEDTIINLDDIVVIITNYEESDIVE